MTYLSLIENYPTFKKHFEHKPGAHPIVNEKETVSSEKVRLSFQKSSAMYD
jgi:hypothetical protein